MLYLASYFSVHPAHYSVLFIAFSGEEPGLIGSAYFVQHPLAPLAKMKFLTNIDIMGDASDGVTVVNATEFPSAYQLLEDLNGRGHLYEATLVVTAGIKNLKRYTPRPQVKQMRPFLNRTCVSF